LVPATGLASVEVGRTCASTTAISLSSDARHSVSFVSFYYLPLSTSRTLPRSSKVCSMCDILTRNKPGSHGHRHYTVDMRNMFSRQRQERPIDLALPSHTRTIHTKNHRPSSSVEGLVDKYDGVEWESKDDVILDEPSLMDLPAEIRGMIYDHLPKPSHGKYYRASN
jgi:hypothetical protein